MAATFSHKKCFKLFGKWDEFLSGGRGAQTPRPYILKIKVSHEAASCFATTLKVPFFATCGPFYPAFLKEGQHQSLKIALSDLCSL